MNLEILIPSEVFLNDSADKISAEAVDGAFTVLPRHIDYVTALVPGLLIYEKNNKEIFIALDEGVLVKQGENVYVSALNAVRGENLPTLKNTVKEKFQKLDEREHKSRSALAMLEGSIIKKLRESQL